MADAVSKVVDFRKNEIDEAPSFNGNINTDYIEGMGKTEDGFIILLNIDKLLSMEDMMQFGEVDLDSENDNHSDDSETGYIESTD